MTTEVKSEVNFKEVLSAVAEYLPGWSLAFPASQYEAKTRADLISADLRIWVRQLGDTNTERLQLWASAWPGDQGDERKIVPCAAQSLGMTVSALRPPQKIARDIERRLILPYREYYKQAQVKAEALALERAATSALLERLSAIVGQEPYGNTLRCLLREHQIFEDGYRPAIFATCKATTTEQVTLEFENVDAQLAEKILRLVTAYYSSEGGLSAREEIEIAAKLLAKHGLRPSQAE